MIDVMIIGAGIAGLTAAVYATRAGKSVAVVEENVYGGQIVNTPEIENYPGYLAISGVELSQNLYDQATKAGAQVLFETVVSIELDGEIKLIKTKQNTYEARTLIIATGVKRRLLDKPGEAEFSGKGVSYCATCDGAFYKGRDVAVVGGGNTAVDDAIYLSNICRTVYVIHRRDQFRADQVLIDKLQARENVKILYDHVVERIDGESAGTVSGLTVQNVKTQESAALSVSGVFVAIGLQPNNQIFEHLVELDENGYIKAGEDCRTNMPGIFVAGDNRTKDVRQLITAAADGCVSAVGAVGML
ncbi:thioredoxin-disulfide reductase [Candidatus Soleaferrea massiliensis]|uniref:thioredoxin-disulfide reductase n=1 Tax=Candidatus Soleaferrea massiliensis TaxID=1470354 RepID=UPI00058B43CD|nr:thioredoxin-disulfide reductase [Candidatus Soleaferrea massiliensis]